MTSVPTCLRLLSGLVLLALLTATTAGASQPRQDCISGRYLNRCYGIFSEKVAAVEAERVDDAGLGVGFIDKQAHMVIQPRFHDAHSFSNGLAAAENDKGLWGYIDHAGEWVIPPRYSEAGFFGSAGVAVATLTDHGGAKALIDREGGVVARFSPQSLLQPADTKKTVFSYATSWPGVVLRDQGKPVPLPVSRGALHRPAFGRVVIRRPNNGGYGVFDIASGSWWVKPGQLQATRLPRLGSDVVGVRRSKNHDPDTTYWVLVQPDGEPATGAHYQSLRTVDNGTWLAQRMQGSYVLCDAHGREVAELDSKPRKGRSLLGDRAVFWTGSKVILLSADGTVKSMPADKPSTARHGGRLWVTEAGASGDRVVQIFSEKGEALLDPDVVEALKDWDAEPIYQYQRERPYPAALERGMPLASLQEKGEYRDSAILTAAGTIVRNKHWEHVQTARHAWPPLVVKTRGGKRGAIDGQGKWVVQPAWDRLSVFHGQYTVGLKSGDDENRLRLIDASGQVVKHVPRRVLDSLESVSGDLLLYRPSQAREQGNAGIWDIQAGKDLLGDGIQKLKQAEAAYIEVRKNDQWGLVDTRGHWVIPPSVDDWDRVGPGVYKGDDNKLYSAVAGGVIASGLSGVDRVGDHRYAVATDAGARLLDNRGHTLYKTAHPVKRTREYGDAGFAVIRFKRLYGLVDAKGDQRIKPRFEHALEFMQPSGWSVADYRILVNRSGKRMLPDHEGKPTLFPGMKRVLFEWHGQQTLVDLQGRVVRKLPDDVSVYRAYAGGGLAQFHGSNRKSGFIDASGKPYIGSYFDKLGPMQDDRAYFAMQDRFGHRLGFMDRSGEITVSPRYTMARSYHNGRAWVFGKKGPAYLDKDGNVQVRFKLHCNRIEILDAEGARTWPPEASECKGKSNSSQGEST